MFWMSHARTCLGWTRPNVFWIIVKIHLNSSSPEHVPYSKSISCPSKRPRLSSRSLAQQYRTNCVQNSRQNHLSQWDQCRSRNSTFLSPRNFPSFTSTVLLIFLSHIGLLCLSGLPSCHVLSCHAVIRMRNYKHNAIVIYSSIFSQISSVWISRVWNYSHCLRSPRSKTIPIVFQSTKGCVYRKGWS